MRNTSIIQKVDGTPHHWIFAVGATFRAVGAILAVSKKQ
jgi:hypothetical protein